MGLEHNYYGDQAFTFSFDKSVIVWDLRTGKKITKLEGHNGEINCCKIDFTGEICATGSSDRTCKVWDIGTGKVLETFEDA